MTGQKYLAALLVAAVPAAASAQESEDLRAEPIVVTAPGGAIDLDDGLSLGREDIAAVGAPFGWKPTMPFWSNVLYS